MGLYFLIFRSFGKRFELPEGLEEVEPQALPCCHDSQHF